MGKTSDPSDFERGARCAGSSFSEASGLLGFSHMTVSTVYQKCPVGENSLLIRGQMRMARIVQASRWATNGQTRAQYNSGVQNSISGKPVREKVGQGPRRLYILKINMTAPSNQYQ
uniref:Uncharacterized protein n=1 Tax=Oncorhynchus mykiss TaxID=8022 RepID=A0A8K9WRU4_ONCMY